MTAHVMGPLVGSDTLGWHATCTGCGHRVEATSQRELTNAHERHVAQLALAATEDQPGPAYCRAVLAETLTRGKPMPPTTELETTQ